MASQNLNVGTTANSNDGDTLRAAFINVRKMFHEIYGISTTYADSLDLSTGGETFAESVQDIIGGMVSGNTEDNIQVTYDDANNKLNFVVAADITDVNAGAGLSGVNEDGEGGQPTLSLDLNGLTAATVNVANDSIGIIDASSSNASRKESIADLVTAIAGSGLTATDGVLSSSGGGVSANSVDHDELAERYTEVQTITTTTGTINLDASSYSNFRLTSDLTGATTLNIQNMKTGQVIDITVSGSQTITFSSDDTSETFNKVGGVDYDGASDNHIQVVCIDDTDSAAIYNYAIGTYTSDTTP